MGRLLGTDHATIAIGLAVFFFGSATYAYTPTLTGAGVPVRWHGKVHLNFAGNAKSRDGISENSFYSSVVRGLQRWQAASGGTVGFDYWQGTDPSDYPASSAYDGISSIYFASNSNRNNALSSNVLGLTEVWYDSSSGRILEADIVLNDRDFQLTTNERDTSGYGSGAISFSTGRSKVFIENVITHELGHVLGLSHSAGLQATMLYMESPEQAHLGCDDQLGLRALYSAEDPVARGGISGVVLSPAGSPVLGAHVLAISRRRGTVLASGVTDASGRYRIEALEPGGYFLVVEPFFGGAQSLPAYYSKARYDICSGAQLFGRTILSGPALGDEVDRPIEIRVNGAAITSAPEIRVRCNPEGGAAISTARGAVSFHTAPVIYDAQIEARDGRPGGFGASGTFRSSGSLVFKLKSLQGRVEIHAMSYSLYSPVRVSLELLDSEGYPVSGRSQQEAYRGTSGFVNYDTGWVTEGLPPGDYFVRVSATFLDRIYYPAGNLALDSVPFFLISGSMNEAEPPLAQVLPLNSRCRLDENFPAYQSPGGAPPRSREAEDSVGFCGTIQNGGTGGSGGGAAASVIFGWSLPYLFLLGWGLRRRGILT